MDVLCSDKTGTLTSGDMVPTRHLDPFGPRYRSGPLPSLCQQLPPNWHQESLERGDSERGGSSSAEYRKIDEIPFDFERRRLSVVVETSGGRLLITKGAPEGVIDIAATAYRDRRPSGSAR